MENPRNSIKLKATILETPDWINILAITPEKKIVVVKQYRFGNGQITTEIPAGIIDNEETPAQAAVRELGEETGYTNVEVGLNFPVEIKGMPLNTNIGSGENQMRIKRIVRMNIRVYQSYGYYVDGQPVPIREFDYSIDSPLNTSPNAKTGIIEDVLNNIGWTRDEMPSITAPDPTPVFIQMIEYEVESS